MWTPQIESRIRKQAAKGVDILIVDVTPEAVSEMGLICKGLGYPRNTSANRRQNGVVSVVVSTEKAISRSRRSASPLFCPS